MDFSVEPCTTSESVHQQRFVSCADGQWYHNLRKQLTLPSTISQPDDEFLPDNSTKRFLDRYFHAVYMTDMAGSPFNDLCILHHSNELFVIGLAPGHSLFRGCFEDSPNGCVINLKPHKILGLDFKVSKNVDRLDNCVRGRRKRGSQIFASTTDPIAFAVCDRGVRHKLVCGLPGRLIEVNKNLALPSDDTKVNLENQSVLQPLGDPNAESERVGIGSYLCIISCLTRRAKTLEHSFKSAKKSRNDHPSSDPDVLDQIFEGEEDELEPDPEEVGSQDPQLWVPVIEALTGHRTLTWDEYANLRGLPTPATR
ncbi:hypothetical protein FGIG_09200 [Fasciola gigantica]|uniref:Protein Abitram n=1 Tax=Fasciola gigantica TaxID=46835 RepID=A0A504YLL3_FASGI|nr:hypothetical protein FGIG_09200 [Fasciola gigantica]